ncbi:PREDICTED: mucin-19-like isoform X2 [Branchiostoma belcheri]|uniref:Mucin-19-like isoform X2 n=1 Tax=Branchiostoma belcheri TaxID=7741 RepID=A0A6P4ZGJ5_BRABE|nr:PREDICTED: mucin-19-like isoform X2 [Branchiostoma belcheri]
MSTTDNADSMESESASASVVTSTSFTSTDADDEGLGTTTYSVSTSDGESTASTSTVTEVRHKRYVVSSSSSRLSSVPVGDPGPEPPTSPTADIVALNARFMYYVDRVRFLEQENRTLRHNVTELEIRSVSPEMYRTFQQEIDRGRQKVADLSTERAHLQVEVQRLEREMRAFNHKVFEESRSRKEALRELEKLKTELYDTKKAYKDAQDNLRLKAQEQDFKTRTHEQNAQLQAEVHQVSHNASTEVTQYVSMLEKREVELETLHRSLEEQREEYQKLMHMKLDLELALQHHGLEYTTIQYDMHDWSPSHRKSSTPKGTPIRRRPLREMDHSYKKRKTEHPSSADGSFLTDEAAYVSAEGGGSASFATESDGRQSGCIITETYTMDENMSQQQTRRSQINGSAGGGSDGQLAMAEARAVDAPELSGPRRVLTAAGEYVVASATSTVRHGGDKGDTTMERTDFYGGSDSSHHATTQAADRPGLSGPKRILTASREYAVVTSSEDQTTTTVTTENRPCLSGPKRALTGEYMMTTSEEQTTTSAVSAEDHPGLSGPKRVLTASGEYVIAKSSKEQMTTASVTAVDRSGLSGPKRVLTPSGEYVLLTKSSEEQTATTTTQAEDHPGLSGPKRVLTPSGEYVVVTESSEEQTKTTTTKSKDRPGLSGPKRVLTSSGEYVVVTESSEEQTTTTSAQAEDRPGLSGPRHVLTASGEHVTMATEGQTTTTTTVQAEDHSGLSGPKRVLTPSGQYVVVTESSEEQKTTTIEGTEDIPGLAGPRRVLTASGEYVVVTSSSEHQTTTTTEEGLSIEKVTHGAGSHDGGPGSYLKTDEVDASGGHVVESSTTEQRVGESGGRSERYSVDVTETTTKRRSKGGTGHAEGSTTSYGLHQETQTGNLQVDGSRGMDYKKNKRVLGNVQLDVTNWSTVSSVCNEKTGDLADNGRASDDVAPSDVGTSGVGTTKVCLTDVTGSREDSVVSVTIKTDRDAQGENIHQGNIVTTHNLGREPPSTSDFDERGTSGREIVEDRTTVGASSSSGNTQMGVHMWGKLPTTQTHRVEDTPNASPTKSGWWRSFWLRSTGTTTSLPSQSVQEDTMSHRASWFQQMEPSFWGKSVSRKENTCMDQDELDASSAKSGWWRFFRRQSTTSTIKHSSQCVQPDVTSHGESGMRQLASYSWGKSVRRETTLTRGVDETDTTAVSTPGVTITGSSVKSGNKTRLKEDAYLVEGSRKTSQACFARICRLCVWLLPLLFLLLLLFFLLSSLFPGGMMGMLLGWERGSCHLQNSFRQSWRFMLKHRSPPPI